MATLTSDLCVVMKPLCSLTAFRNNARTHSKRQIRQIAESIKTFGFTNPVLLGRKTASSLAMAVCRQQSFLG